MGRHEHGHSSTTLRRHARRTDTPVDVLVSFENPIGILRNCRAALALLSTIRLDEDSSMPTGSNMGHWLILQSIMQALEHAEKLLMAEAREATP